MRQPDASIEAKTSPSRRTLLGLDWLNFLLADVQTGVGPFLAIYLAGYKWDEERVGLALTVGGIAGILTQTPAGALVDFFRSKRALVGVAIAALAAGALLIALLPSFWPAKVAIRPSIRQGTLLPPCRWASSATSFPIGASSSSSRLSPSPRFSSCF